MNEKISSEGGYKYTRVIKVLSMDSTSIPAD
jgi:hypothetical protein